MRTMRTDGPSSRRRSPSAASIQKIIDDCSYGDVVRWIAAGKFQYAAIYVSTGGWFTSAREGGPVAQVLTTDGLARLLSKMEVSDVEVSQRWLRIK